MKKFKVVVAMIWMADFFLLLKNFLKHQTTLRSGF